MKPTRVLALGSLLAVGLTTAQAYDVVERFKIIDDKLKTEAMLRPIDHDFFFDVNATINKNLKTVIDDVDKATKFQGTDAEKLAEAQKILVKYEKTEQTVKVNVNLGFPLPSFTAWKIKFKPNFRALVDVGANLGIRAQRITVTDIINYFPQKLPEDLKTFIPTLTTGQDVVQQCNSSSLSATTKAFCATLPLGKYIMPSLSQDVPTISVFGKGDAKVGFFNDYIYDEHFFGNFNLYGMGRADLYQIITSEQIAKGQSIEAPDKMNTETTVQMDYRLGYRNTNYTAFMGVEELKLTKLSDPKEGSKPHSYDYDPLIRLHADATYRVSALSLQPFIGLHKRTGYGFGDGVYAGTIVGAHVWGDRLGLQMRGMLDKQYITIAPRVKLWLMQLEYSLKKPLKEMDGDVKLTALHTLDFRIFF